MLFVKYAPAYLKNLLKVITLLFHLVVLFIVYVNLGDYWTIRDTVTIYAIYIVLNFLLLFAFKPIIKKYPKTYPKNSLDNIFKNILKEVGRLLRRLLASSVDLPPALPQLRAQLSSAL